MNDQIQPDGSGAEHDHGALGDAEYAEFMELAAVEGFDIEDVEGAIDEAGHGPLPVLAVVGQAERRQVDSRQPHHRPPRGRRGGQARRHA